MRELEKFELTQVVGGADSAPLPQISNGPVSVSCPAGYDPVAVHGTFDIGGSPFTGNVAMCVPA